MNRETFERLKTATAGHTPGPWYTSNENGDIESKTRILFVGNTNEPQDSLLAAAAPELLAEVERLRGWMAWVLDADEHNGPYAWREMCEDALNGAEVPK